MFSSRKLVVNQDSWFVSLAVHLLISCNFSVLEYNHYYNNWTKCEELGYLGIQQFHTIM